MTPDQFEALACAWVQLTEEAGLPPGYDGFATPEAHRACEAMQLLIRDRIVATGDTRLQSLFYLLGQASLLQEQVLWPEETERTVKELERRLRDLDTEGF